MAVSGPVIESKEGGSNDTIMFSSLSAFTESLPKVIIIWKTEKKVVRLGRRKNGEISAKIIGYDLYYLTDDSVLVPWVDKPSHKEIMKLEVTEENTKKIKKILKKQHELFSEKSIKFQSSFMNNAGKNYRLQYIAKDVTKLPSIPDSEREKEWYRLLTEGCDKLIGATLRIKKYNKPGLKGKRVFVTEEIFRMEESEKERTKSSKKSKDPGELYMKLSVEKEDICIESFKSGRQEHWVGFAIEDCLIHLVDELDYPAKGNTTGIDIIWKK